MANKLTCLFIMGSVLLFGNVLIGILYASEDSRGGEAVKKQSGGNPVIEAPAGAVVYDEPVSFELVEIDGFRYYRHNNVYYRPHFGGGYEVVRIKEHHDERGHDHGHH